MSDKILETDENFIEEEDIQDNICDLDVENVDCESIEDDKDLDAIHDNEDSQKKERSNSKKLLSNSVNFNSTFKISLIVGVVLSLVAIFLVRPQTGDLFYIFYFLIFILFSAGSLFCCYIAQHDVSALNTFYEKFKNSRGKKEDLVCDNDNINEICNAYKESFLVNETYNKTRSNADLYFGGETYFNDMHEHIPIQSFLKIIPGTFIGFGILGTFIGFAGGLSSINIADSQSLLTGVQNLLDGLRSAFNTSIVGVLASMFFNFVMIHPMFNRLDQCSKKLCDYLDTKFFVSEVDAMSVTNENNETIPFPQTMGIILDKLDIVASTINQMGAIVGDQVTQSVKATLDKTIEKIIKEEIIKLKEEMNTSISLLRECQKHLQNAPNNLKSATEKLESVGNEFNNINERIGYITENFVKVDESIKTTTENLSNKQETLEAALMQAAEAFEKTVTISESITENYEIQTSRIDEMILKFTDLLNEYKTLSSTSKEIIEGYKCVDEQISNVFANINENISSYSDVIGKALSGYLTGFTDATKNISAKFADATDSLREEVEKLNKISMTNKV